MIFGFGDKSLDPQYPQFLLGTAKCIAVSGAGEGLAETRRFLEFESTQKTPSRFQTLWETMYQGNNMDRGITGHPVFSVLCTLEYMSHAATYLCAYVHTHTHFTHKWRKRISKAILILNMLKNLKHWGKNIPKYYSSNSNYCKYYMNYYSWNLNQHDVKEKFI